MITLAIRNNPYWKDNSFDKAMRWFSDKIFGKNDYDGGHFFMEDIKEWLDNSKYPCDKIVIDPFRFLPNFVLVFKYKDMEISRVEISLNKEGIFKIEDATYKALEFKKCFHSILEDFIKERNKQTFEWQASKCGLQANKDSNVIEIEYFDTNQQREPLQTQELKGSLAEIFDTFTDMNETYKYCNGVHWSFKREEVRKLYRTFVSSIKDYFLLNAVQHGRLID